MNHDEYVATITPPPAWAERAHELLNHPQLAWRIRGAEIIAGDL